MYPRSLGKLKAVGHALYEPEPEIAEGFTAEDYETGPVEVFPENWEAVSVFQQLRTQWNTGVNGATGLNYLVMLAWVARLDLSKDDEDQLIFDLQILEISALNAMRGGTLDV